MKWLHRFCKMFSVPTALFHKPGWYRVRNSLYCRFLAILVSASFTLVRVQASMSLKRRVAVAKALLGFICALSFCVLASSSLPTCVPFSSAVAPTMRGVVPEGLMVVVPGGFTLAEMERKFVAPTGLALSGIQNKACRDAFARMVAASAFPPCQLNGVPAPSLPCRSVCFAALKACSVSAADYNLLDLLSGGFGAFNASCFARGGHGLFPLPSIENFPVSESFFPPAFTTQCNNPTISVNVTFGQCAPYTGTVCKGIIPANQLVYFKAGSCSASVEDVLASFPTVLTALSPNCQKHAAQAVCNLAFPLCDTTTALKVLRSAPGVSSTLPLPSIPLPSLPQKRYCENMHAACPLVDPSLGFGDTAWLAGYANASASSFGLFLNTLTDGARLLVTLGPAGVYTPPSCQSSNVAPAPQSDFPSNITVFGSQTIQNASLTFYTPANAYDPTRRRERAVLLLVMCAQ